MLWDCAESLSGKLSLDTSLGIIHCGGDKKPDTHRPDIFLSQMAGVDNCLVVCLVGGPYEGQHGLFPCLVKCIESGKS